MTIKSFQIRTCLACGLRYPLVEGHTFGTRCPACLGETRLILSRHLILEPARNLPSTALIARPSSTKREELAVLLDNIRSAWNTGSIFRTADGFGMTHIFLCGITPTPENEAVTRTSLGAEDSIPWSYHKDAVKLVKGLKKEGWKIYALEEKEGAKEILHASRESGGKAVLILGNEITGIDPGLLDLCDEVYRIPMYGEKKSFNVAIAFGIAAFVMRKIQNDPSLAG
ncbi:MAG TPA: RNA methyltransferase [Anaerolineales bacterium]|nr:RNA methyltransferase [Anaerolineales bacterium]